MPTSAIDNFLQICLRCLNSNRSFDKSPLPCTSIELLLIIYDVYFSYQLDLGDSTTKSSVNKDNISEKLEHGSGGILWLGVVA